MSLITVSKIQKESAATNIDVPSTGQFIDLASAAQGDVLYYNGTSYVRLAPGTSGQVLQTQGAAANPIWAADASGKVLQIVQTTMNTTASTTSTSFVASGLIASFASLASTSSKIFITLSGGNTWNYPGEVHTTLYASIASGSYANISASDFLEIYKGVDLTKAPHSLNYLYSPSTISSVSIQPYYKCSANTAYFNEATVKVNLIMMEIGA
jgi:hypothetical protein